MSSRRSAVCFLFFLFSIHPVDSFVFTSLPKSPVLPKPLVSSCPNTFIIYTKHSLKMQSSIFAATLLAACVRAIQITSPTKNEVVDLAAGVKVTWSTVSSDPRKAHLFLTNMASGHTPFSKDLGEVDLSEGSITVTETVDDDTTYQFNFQSVSNQNMGILAQSQQFEAKVEDDKESKSTTSSSTKATSTSTKTSTKGATTTKGSAASLVSEASDAEETAESSMASVTRSSSATKTSARADASSTGAASANQVGGMLALVAGIVAIVA